MAFFDELSCTPSTIGFFLCPRSRREIVIRVVISTVALGAFPNSDIQSIPLPVPVQLQMTSIEPKAIVYWLNCQSGTTSDRQTDDIGLLYFVAPFSRGEHRANFRFNPVVQG